ncbi:Histidine kinase-, DNA gyrase B-, and HSP90-like ATPase [Gracilibacillus orientalis]|uniref:Histidine kinase-, DNA gyrase B-, and HSP90-like ATPase n=1 Tax=Gracilibacillus orientalis TaxID=334253 RepID=A0A1I4J400_9BACI|nr:ATP-binding protein [Gracilibacillus orientalis]SFL61325.1 Histidine kinase-, DNA gyrase B-, and HSP90-like ATPase [Gracilibacillus orientalis]
MQSQIIKDNMLKNSAAGTIFNELEKLKKSSKEDQNRLRRRWVWELIQNACDCCRDGEQVDITITFNGKSILTFSHNGKGFNEENLWSMVTQISSKQSDDSTTGQFGTGFITTTLLAPQISIASFMEDNGNPFVLNLDRSGQTREEIRQSVESNIQLIENVISKTDTSCEERNITTFTYDLTSSPEQGNSIDSINKGIESLGAHLYYLMNFNGKIKSITYNGKILEVCKRVPYPNIPNSNIVTIREVHTGDQTFIFNSNFEGGSIAFPLLVNDGFWNFDEIPETVTRLYCDFPLIGSEDYPFPVVLNSDKFNVAIDRNGIFEADPSNIAIIQKAINQFNVVLEHFSNQPQMNNYYLCKFDRKQMSEYRINLKKQLDTIIMSKNMVETNQGTLLPINDSKGNVQIFVPRTQREEFKKEVWTLFSEIPNLTIPTFLSADGWRDVINNDIDLDDVIKKQLIDKSLDDFKEWFGGTKTIEWLNEYYQLLCDMYNKDFDKVVVPNTEGTFCQPRELILGDNILPDLRKILAMVDYSIETRFVYPGITVPEKIETFIPKFSNKDIAEIISSYTHSLLSKEKADNRTTETESLFASLLSLFAKLPTECEKLFPNLYEERAKLRSKKFVDDLNQLGDIISERNVSVDSINAIFSNENLMRELQKSSEELSDEVKQQLHHIYKHSFYSKQKIDELINRSTRNVFQQLHDNPNYDIPETLQEWETKKLSPTVFKAKKNENEIFIVIRPSDDDKIIFHEDKELSVLDSNFYELWTDNGSVVKQITLGDILKTTNISVIPLKNIY